MHLSLRLAFARTDCTPYDTLCTYGVKQLKTPGLYFLLLYQALAGHLRRLREMHYLEHGRRYVAELAALA